MKNFKHKGHAVHKVGLSEGCGAWLKTFTQAGLMEVVTLHYALNLRDLCVLRGKK